MRTGKKRKNRRKQDKKSKILSNDEPDYSDMKVEGGGTLAERVASDLGGFIGEEGK